jgi:hypothetical protein
VLRWIGNAEPRIFLSGLRRGNVSKKELNRKRQKVHADRC